MESSSLEKKLDQVLSIVSSMQSTQLDHDKKLKDIEQRFDNVDEGIEELRSSSGALDRVLEAHPIGHIERLEVHTGLPKFVANSQVE